MKLFQFAFAVAAAALMCGSSLAQQPSYHVTGKIPLADGGWDLVTVDGAARRLYVSRPDRVTEIDLDTAKVTDKLAASTRGHTALPVNKGAEILVTNGGANAVSFNDAKTGAELANLKVGQGPDVAILDSVTGLVVVMNHVSGGVTLLDPAKHTVVATIDVPGALEFGAADGKGNVFVNVEDKNEMVAIDLKAQKVVQHIKLDGCDGPTGLAYLPNAKRMMASCGNGVAALVDPAALKFDKTLPIGMGPDAVIYDHVRKLAFIPCGRSGDLSVFSDEAKGVTPKGSIKTQTGARIGAVDEKTGRLYLPAADYEAPAAGGRPAMKPGSVVLVTVDP